MKKRKVLDLTSLTESNLNLTTEKKIELLAKAFEKQTPVFFQRVDGTEVTEYLILENPREKYIDKLSLPISPTNNQALTIFVNDFAKKVLVKV